MTPSEYVATYLNLPVPLGESHVSKAWVRNYLHSGLGIQSVRAQSAQARLIAAVCVKLQIDSNLPATFQFEGHEVVYKSIKRVFMGKGAPDEIQTVLWMASCCGLLEKRSLSNYCDNNLGIDASGFVANYWGIGKPARGDEHPVGWSGLKPRYIWHTNRAFRRGEWREIQVGDAAIFFRGVRKDNPDQALTKNSYGSEAVHIGIVAAIYPGDAEDTVRLRIAESSGAARSDGGSGVYVRDIGQVTVKTARSLVYFENEIGNERCYFTGPLRQPSPYEAEYNGNLQERLGKRT